MHQKPRSAPATYSTCSARSDYNYAASEATLSQPNSGVAAASWMHPQTGTQNHGAAMGGALAVLTQADGAGAGDVATTKNE